VTPVQFPKETDAAAYSKIVAAFGETERPQQFTVEDGDFECIAADNLWSGRTPGTLEFGDLFETLSFPDTELLEKGWLYFFPGFVRLALQNADREAQIPPGERLILYMLSENCRLWKVSTKTQRAAVADFIEYFSSRANLITADDIGEYEKVTAYWRRSE